MIGAGLGLVGSESTQVSGPDPEKASVLARTCSHRPSTSASQERYE